MQVISDGTMEKLLSACKEFLGITWSDYGTDSMLKSYIRSSATRLSAIYGYDIVLDTDSDEAGQADSLAHDLLLNRVFYMREKALDDFETNYRGDLLTLRNLGKVRGYEESHKETETEAGDVNAE